MKMKTMAVVMLTAGLTGMLTACGGGNGQQQQQLQQQAPTLAVMTVQAGNSELESSFPATIKGKTDIAIRPQVTGFITNVLVDEGQKVHKGQLMFTLDPVQYQAAVDQAQASVNVATTAVATAQLQADNNRKLYEKNIISESAKLISDNQLAQARAQLEQANAALVSARKNLAFTQVTSPSDGVVGSIPNREGSLASPSSAQPLTTVSENGDVYAYFSLNEKDILSLTNNGEKTLDEALKAMPEVSLRLADGSIFGNKGKVSTISGVLDNATGSANVRALFKNMNGVLRSGSTGAVLLPQLNENVIIIPQKATFEIQDKKFVYVLDENNTAHSVGIEISPINDGQSYVVKSGLNPGDRIVVEGVGVSVRDGVQIQPKTAE
ncbi:MAG: efflux RND transporter periplasmic adaptor subunit [Muribaculaceae bacterium]|nr:efflux RND transporter periplasmic adaptor subunit [Muribaculaceae bacterium]